MFVWALVARLANRLGSCQIVVCAVMALQEALA